MQPNTPKQGPNWPLIAFIAGVSLPVIMSIIFVIFGIYYSNLSFHSKGENLHNSGLAGTSNSGGGSTTDCSGVASVPAEYLPYVKKAADSWMGGDQAALIAVIQHESGWRPNAKNSTSSASGLGQFLTSTAGGGGFPEFTGGDDQHGTVWPAGTVYQDPQNHPDDARFEAKRAIFAAAHYLGRLMELPKNHGDIGLTYFNNYHGGGSFAVGSRPYEEGLKGKQDVERIYNALKNGNGCKEVASTSGGSGSSSSSDTSGPVTLICDKGGGGSIPSKIAACAKHISELSPEDPARKNSTFFAADPPNACASFVSTVLQQVGAFPSTCFTRAAPALATLLPQRGAVQVVANYTDRAQAVNTLSPGDIVLFFETPNRIHHSGVYIGSCSAGSHCFVAISSSKGIVRAQELMTYASYDHLAAYRFR